MKDAIDNSVKINARSITTVSILSVVYLLLSIFLVGFKSDQLVLIGIFNVLFYASVITRKFILGFSIFIFYWILFDYMKAIPNYMINPVHIADLYNLEKHIFGINFHGKILTPNEYWLANSNSTVDVITGLFYLCWIPVPLGMAAYLFFKNRREFLYFALTFLLVNLLGFVIYYTYPAAPPWYIQQYGFQFHPLTLGSTGGLARFDNYFHIQLFKSIYAKGSNVFAAMPSLHSAYPMIVLYYGYRNRLGLANIFFAIVVLGIWFTAVYASHHYVLDVLAGITTAIIGISLFMFMANRSKTLRGWLDKYEAAIK